MELIQLLTRLQACKDSIKWVGNKTLKEAWTVCEHGDWMLWFLVMTGRVSLKQKIAIKLEWALLVRHLIKDKRSLKALEVAEKFVKDEITIALNVQKNG